MEGVVSQVCCCQQTAFFSISAPKEASSTAPEPTAVDKRSALELRNALVQRDSALVTRWWSFKLKLTTLLALVEF